MVVFLTQVTNVGLGWKARIAKTSKHKLGFFCVNPHWLLKRATNIGKNRNFSAVLKGYCLSSETNDGSNVIPRSH